MESDVRMLPLSAWAAAVEAAGKLQADYPQWQVRAVQRREGPGVTAQRDDGALCTVVGSAAEVRQALAAAATELTPR